MTNRPPLRCLKPLQEYSTRGWVYRLEEGWVFAELTPDELAEFKSYGSNITVSRMRVRLPYGPVVEFFHSVPPHLVNWFAYYTMPKVHPLAQIAFQIQQVTTQHRARPSMYWPFLHSERGNFAAWLWPDEVEICRELGCAVTLHYGFGWKDWGVPSEWRPPIASTSQPQYKQYTYIYILQDEFSREIGYVGQSIEPERRLAEHLKDTENPDKVSWIQSRLAQGHAIKLFILEKVPSIEAYERERYWISYYWKQGYRLTNRVCREWKKPFENWNLSG